MASTSDLRAQAKLQGDRAVRAKGVNQKGSLRNLVASAEKKAIRAEVQVGIIDEGFLRRIWQKYKGALTSWSGQASLSFFFFFFLYVCVSVCSGASEQQSHRGQGDLGSRGARGWKGDLGIEGFGSKCR